MILEHMGIGPATRGWNLLHGVDGKGDGPEAVVMDALGKEM